MRAINVAWATLRDPARRDSYDRGLGVVVPGRAPSGRPITADIDDRLADLEDDAPLGGQVVLPRWLSLVPVGVFVASIGMFVAGVLFSSSSALAVSFALFALSCALFLIAPFVALFASRRRG